LPLVFQTRVTDKTQIPLQTKQGQKKHRQRIDPFYSVQIFDLMHNCAQLYRCFLLQVSHELEWLRSVM